MCLETVDLVTPALAVAKGTPSKAKKVESDTDNEEPVKAARQAALQTIQEVCICLFNVRIIFGASPCDFPFFNLVDGFFIYYCFSGIDVIQMFFAPGFYVWLFYNLNFWRRLLLTFFVFRIRHLRMCGRHLLLPPTPSVPKNSASNNRRFVSH